jgi:tetratricopeptide (TPR) repeat protein
LRCVAEILIKLLEKTVSTTRTKGNKTTRMVGLGLATSAILVGFGFSMTGDSAPAGHDLLDQAYAAHDSGDFDGAIAAFDRAIELDPASAEAYANRGVSWSEQGKHQRALADYNKALEIDPEYATVYYNRGNAWDDAGEYDLAIADFNTAIGLNPGDSYAYNNLGNAWGSKGDLANAIAAYDKAIELNPEQAVSLNNRGTAWGRLGEFERSKADLDAALQSDPSMAASLNRSLLWMCDKGRDDKTTHDVLAAPSDGSDSDPIRDVSPGAAPSTVALGR